MRSKALFGALGLVVALTAFPVMVSWAEAPPSDAPSPSSSAAAEEQPTDQAKSQTEDPAPADPAPATTQPADPAPSTSTAPDPAPAAAAPADPAPAAPPAAAPAAPEAADPSPPVRPDGGQPPAVVVPGPTTPVPAPSAGSPTPKPSPTGSTSPSPSPSPSASPSAPAEPSTLTLRQRLVLTGDSDHDGRADRGDTVRVVISVTNSGGQVTLRSVQVVDSLFKRLGSPVTCGTSVLAPGASTSCSSGSVSIRRAQAKAGVFSNQARATARTTAGALVRSAASTATLAVQRPAPRHRHHHKNKKHHKKGRHADRHRQGRLHDHRARMRHVKPPSAKLQLNQFVLKVVDVDKNGRLDAGDSVRFGFQVSNTGSLPVADLHIVDRRLTHFKVPLTCPTTTLDAGAATVCTSGPMEITRYQAKKRLGQNFAYAAGTAGGTAVRSNSTVIPLQRSTSALRRLKRLPNTGSSVTERELGFAGMLLLGGAFLLTGGRRRTPLVPGQRSLPGADPRRR